MAILQPAGIGAAQAAATALAIAVGLGEAFAVKTVTSDQESLVAYGLGSCVAVCLFDPTTSVAGMAHVVLPGADPTGSPNPKFAKSAIPALLETMRAKGASRNLDKYLARLAGGAQVLSLGGSGTLPRIGEQNSAAIQEALGSAGLAVHAMDLGGNRGRTVWFNPREGGVIRVRTVGGSERQL